MDCKYSFWFVHHIMHKSRPGLKFGDLHRLWNKAIVSFLSCTTIVIGSGPPLKFKGSQEGAMIINRKLFDGYEVRGKVIIMFRRWLKPRPLLEFELFLLQLINLFPKSSCNNCLLSILTKYWLKYIWHIRFLLCWSIRTQKHNTKRFFLKCLFCKIIL